jgi:hypothetical protein
MTAMVTFGPGSGTQVYAVSMGIPLLAFLNKKEIC